MRNPRALLRILLAAALVAAVADLVALRRGILHHRPGLLGAIVLGVAGLLLVELASTVRDATRGDARAPALARALARALALAGVLVALAGGTLNWLRSLQGFIVLAEGDAVALARGAQLQGYEAGLLADDGELDVSLRLDEVELVAADDGFVPESRVTLTRAGGEPRRMQLRPGQIGAEGALRFRQGAFGFAPRIVIVENGRTVFDRVVPFTTRREGARGVAFEGAFQIEREGLAARGAVSLDTLDETMRGHPMLGLELRKGDVVLGSGELMPGHFADVAQGYRIGFAGLSRWSEVDVARRVYRAPVVAGAILAGLGLFGWVGLSLRRRR